MWATGTEDMDALTLGTPILLRNLTLAEARKKPILEVATCSLAEGELFLIFIFNHTLADFAG